MSTVLINTSEIFLQLWPNKFQNKTNGVTPRRWLRFCNPELSKIITDWIGTEDWVLNTEKLAELRKVLNSLQFHVLKFYRFTSSEPVLAWGNAMASATCLS